jgi:FkbM family methyltransferase
MENIQTLTNSLGQTVTVFRDDHVGDKIAIQGLYEKENLALLLNLLEHIHQPVVMDIGANIGNHALAFATVARQVYAFEPVPAIYNLLTRNIRQNSMQHVHACNMALSDVAGEDIIHMVTKGNYGASSFDRRTEQSTAVPIKKITGDSFVAGEKLIKVDLLKIDVEAHEVYVLRGLQQTLERQKPFITMEWNDPLTIERLCDSAELTFLFNNYIILVLGSNYDRGFYIGKPLAFIRRKLTRFFRKRTAVLYRFNPEKLYKNLLLIPKEKEAILGELGCEIWS